MLDGRVCIVTGGGRGIGREHALLLAELGAKVVVNDLGGATDGSGADTGPAFEVVDEIRSSGGQAVANTDSVSDWAGSRRLISQAIDTYGDLHVLVNNAGVLRNRVLVHMTEDELDSVINVHIKGHFATARWASEYWRDQAKAGTPRSASIVNTASCAMLGTPGLSNYTAAKAGIAAATLTMAMELTRYGVRANCIAPIARTRLAGHGDHITEMVKAPADPNDFDIHDPGNVAPLVAYLATADCPFNGGVFHVGGGEVGLYRGWSLSDRDVLVNDRRWTVEELQTEAAALLEDRGELASVTTYEEETYLGRRPVTARRQPSHGQDNPKGGLK
jgi:NAD(P)-dependent dehydrogenase (short-subunit alcohol dehydrogenase family)